LQETSERSKQYNTKKENTYRTDLEEFSQVLENFRAAKLMKPQFLKGMRELFEIDSSF